MKKKSSSARGKRSDALARPAVPKKWSELYSRDLNEAMRETEAIIAADPSRENDPTLPIFQVACRGQLELERQRFESGDRMALFAAIRVCANHDVLLPRWVSDAFIHGYDAVLWARVGSWDEAFGKPYPGKQIGRLRQARLNRMKIWRSVRAAVAKGESVNVDLFERIGREVGVGKTRAQELYAEAVRLVDAASPGANRPAKKRRLPGLQRKR